MGSMIHADCHFMAKLIKNREKAHHYSRCTIFFAQGKSLPAKGRKTRLPAVLRGSAALVCRNEIPCLAFEQGWNVGVISPGSSPTKSKKLPVFLQEQ